MKKPFKYFVLCNKTKKMLWQSNQPPELWRLQTWTKVDSNNSVLTQTKTAFIDTRYAAKLRLYNYLLSRKKTHLQINQNS